MFKLKIKLFERIAQMQRQIEMIQCRMDIKDEIFEKFMQERCSSAYNSVFEKEQPLVSICIATFNRGELLTQRTLKSLINQTYENIEIIVIGDCCTDNTELLVRDIHDSRINFVNLPERGHYPPDPLMRWMVAGTTPINYGLQLAKGDFITHLDDDDEHDFSRIAKLVEFIQQTKVDLVFHPFWFQDGQGNWKLNDAKEFVGGKVTTSSIFYHNWFKNIPWDINACRYQEAGDWNRLRDIKYLGAKVARYNEPMLRHYRERTQKA